MMEKTLAEKIMELRKKAGISQKTLGEYMGLTNRAVSKWENGISVPTTQNLLKLSKIFNVSIDYFCGEENTGKEIAEIQGMESLTELYKIGRGPSSSHTIGPEKACKLFGSMTSSADYYKVILYGSLAKTGKGHGTDVVIKKTFHPTPCMVEFNYTEERIPHPNTMDLYAYKGKKVIASERVMSVGGGRIQVEGNPAADAPCIYNLHSFTSIAEYCKKNRIRLWQYAMEKEDTLFPSYMREIWSAMKESIHKGLEDEGILPGGLNVHKKAKQLLEREHIDETAETRENRLVCSYAFAVSEQNASGEPIVTAPTCGASGVLPAVLYYQQQKHNYSDEQIIRALITGGMIGNLIKTNASISGAECGCQAEIGSACAMAAAALGELFGLSLDKIEYAAEISIEHHLGLTCDPICGLVQIPCIERNAVAAMRAINAVNIASFLSDTRKISLDNVIHVMKETGHDISAQYKETSEGGLAKIVIN